MSNSLYAQLGWLPAPPDDFAAQWGGLGLLFLTGGSAGGVVTGDVHSRYVFSGETSDIWSEGGIEYKAFTVSDGLVMIELQ